MLFNCGMQNRAVRSLPPAILCPYPLLPIAELFIFPYYGAFE